MLPLAPRTQAWWQGSVKEFLTIDIDQVIGQLAKRSGESGYETTRDSFMSWQKSLSIMKSSLQAVVVNRLAANSWHVFFEFEIPRRQSRPDAIILTQNQILVVEFKVGARAFDRKDKFQTCDYAKDLRDFHEGSNGLEIVPILLASEAPDVPFVDYIDDRLDSCCLTNSTNFKEVLEKLTSRSNMGPLIDAAIWSQSRFAPTPDIITAARHIYLTHSVSEIKHHRADNLDLTISVIQEVITDSQKNLKNNICFVTGEPGSGKTLVGLSATHAVGLDSSSTKHGTYLSGNLPLVKVLRYAIAVDHAKREKLNYKEAERRTSTFIQPAHAFFGELQNNGAAPSESVLIFDEAQRAWDAKHNQKNSSHGVLVSEADSTLSIMERLNSGSTIVALVGTGQEINRGEAGIKEWIKALDGRPNWGIFAPSTKEFPPSLSARVHVRPNLNLPKSVREVRGRGLSQWVNFFLAGDFENALELSRDLGDFTLMQTRSLDHAKKYLRDRASIDRRTGLIASSQDRRLRAFGIERSTHFLRGIDFAKWFVHDEKDIRSSYALEVAASEFECQGLEIDWVGMCWGSDLLWRNSSWSARRFKGTKWQIDGDSTIALNRYRVLLTRARYGMIIWIPSDPDSEKHYVDNSALDEVSRLLLSAGVKSLPDNEVTLYD